MTRGWVALGLVGVAALSGCTSKPAPLPTLPPLTGSATPSEGASSPSTNPSTTPTPSDTPASVSPTDTATPSAGATPIPGLHPPAGNSTDAALATAKAYVYSLFALDYNMDPKPMLAVTTSQCVCRERLLADLALTKKRNAHGVGAMPTGVMASLIDRFATQARVQVTYDTHGAKEVDDNGKVWQIVPPTHVSFHAYLAYRGGRWLVVETV